MEEKRHVSKMQSVFDLSDCVDSSIPGGSMGRVMFLYDEKKNLREFTILSRGTPEEIQINIKTWLENNIDVRNPIWGTESTASDIVV